MKRKSLMHIDQKNAIQFVTFRTQESVAYYLAKNNINTTESIAKQQLKQDKFLDSSSAGAYFEWPSDPTAYHLLQIKTYNSLQLNSRLYYAQSCTSTF